MSLNLPPRGPVDDWQVVRQCLPHGWEGAAYAHRAIERSRRIRDPAMLLRVLLVHLADHGSLQETCVRSAQAGWGALTKAALFKRLQAAAPWLAWMSARLWRTAPPTAAGGRRLRAVDATAVTGPGESGGVWRVHYAINLASLHGDWCELTDAAGGETLRRVPVRPGDVLLGDRTYGTPRGLPSVLTQDADVLVRGTRHHLPLFTPQGPAWTCSPGYARWRWVRWALGRPGCGTRRGRGRGA